MILNHTGFSIRSEDEAFHFYAKVLGFEKTREFTVPADLAHQLFSMAGSVRVLVFERDGIRLELFICPDCGLPAPDFRHVGLYVPDLDQVLSTARENGVEVIVGQIPGKNVYFLRDFSGNLVEIKQG